MVQGKLLEYAEDLKRFCVNHKWAKFFRDYEDGDEGLAKYEDFYKNSYDDYKDAARGLCYEIIEYFDLLWNQLPDKDLYLEDEKQNPRNWLDGVSKILQTTVSDMKEGPELFGFLLKGSQMLAWIKEAATKTDEQFYGGRRTDVMPHYLGESTEKTFQNILNESELIKQVFAQILRESEKLKEASFTIGEFCRYKGIENPEAFRDFLRKLWDFNHVELWTQSDSDSLERAFDKYQTLREASVFKPSGFGLSGHYDYEAPEKELVYVATETNEDDGELYFDETGCTTEFIENAKKFTSEEQAFEFAKDNVIFGTPGAKLRESDSTYKAKVQGKWLKGNSLVKDKKDADTFESKTEPTQRINQMKKDGKIDKNAKITVKEI